MRGSGKVKILDAGKTGNLGNGGLSSLKHLPRNARKRLRRHGKRLGKRRLRDFQPLNHIEHGLLPAERPKVSFVAAFRVPRMRGSVYSVVLYFGMLKKYAGTVPQVI